MLQGRAKNQDVSADSGAQGRRGVAAAKFWTDPTGKGMVENVVVSREIEASEERQEERERAYVWNLSGAIWCMVSAMVLLTSR